MENILKCLLRGGGGINLIDLLNLCKTKIDYFQIQKRNEGETRYISPPSPGAQYPFVFGVEWYDFCRPKKKIESIFFARATPLPGKSQGTPLITLKAPLVFGLRMA